MNAIFVFTEIAFIKIHHSVTYNNKIERFFLQKCIFLSIRCCLKR